MDEHGARCVPNADGCGHLPSNEGTMLLLHSCNLTLQTRPVHEAGANAPNYI